jgi:hypothetical protein
VNEPGQAGLHVLAQSIVRGKLRRLRPSCSPVTMPLRDHRSIDQLPAASGRVAPQFAGDRRRRSAQMRRDPAHAVAVGTADRDLFSLGEGQVAAGVWLEV